MARRYYKKRTRRTYSEPSDYTAVRFHFITDPGHGWVKVSHRLLEKLGIAGKITDYSYETKFYAFLEEDMDAKTFFDAFEAHFGQAPNFKFINIENDQSVVRTFRSYSKGLSRRHREAI